MANDIDSLKANLRGWTLLLGVIQITVGCMVGLIPPPAVAWFRGIVMAHIEFTINGILLVAFGLLVKDLRLNPIALRVWFATLLVGTWANGAAGLAGAFIGSSSKLMPTLNEKFPAPHSLDSPVVTGLLLLCAVSIMVALVLTIFGLLRSRVSAQAADAQPTA